MAFKKRTLVLAAAGGVAALVIAAMAIQSSNADWVEHPVPRDCSDSECARSLRISGDEYLVCPPNPFGPVRDTDRIATLAVSFKVCRFGGLNFRPLEPGQYDLPENTLGNLERCFAIDCAPHAPGQGN